ncbi:MAG: alpha/beta fold hydrolase [Aestuariivita sp.]|nr:alpha/beta fold hydrolase [Aestuariivita sp.]
MSLPEPMRWPPPSDWPMRSFSRQVYCSPHRWHVQETGDGPTLLLLHGAGSSSHSFRHLVPLLEKNYHIVTVDLPGQGYTQLGTRNRCGLDAMAADVISLAEQEHWKPKAIIGHSAGAVLGLRVSQLQHSVPAVIGINPALDNFRGIAGLLFPITAKLLSLTPGVSYFFSRISNNPKRIRMLLESTGSKFDSVGLDYYRRLLADPSHVNGALLMMSQWPVDGLQLMWPEFTAKIFLIVGEKDGTVSPSVARLAASKMPHAEFVSVPELGHLAHEEDANTIVSAIRRFLNELPDNNLF